MQVHLFKWKRSKQTHKTINKRKKGLLFIGFTYGTEIDLLAETTNGSTIEYYFSLGELFEDYGNDAEYSIIYLKDVEIILEDLTVMSFNDIEMN